MIAKLIHWVWEFERCYFIQILLIHAYGQCICSPSYILLPETLLFEVLLIFIGVIVTLFTLLFIDRFIVGFLPPPRFVILEFFPLFGWTTFLSWFPKSVKSRKLRQEEYLDSFCRVELENLQQNDWQHFSTWRCYLSSLLYFLSCFLRQCSILQISFLVYLSFSSIKRLQIYLPVNHFFQHLILVK